MKTLSVAIILSITISTVAFSQTATHNDQFKRHIAELQKSPDDQALREKIIKLALTLDPKPEIPEDAERFNARGKAAVKDAQSQKDFAEAAIEFEKATLAAPWLANPYFNLADTQSKSGDYAKAAQNLKLYLLAAPDSPDAKAVKELMYEMEFKAEKIEKAKAEEQRREKEARDEQKRRDAAAAAERRRQEEIAVWQRAQAERLESAKEERRKPIRVKYEGSTWVYVYKPAPAIEYYITCERDSFHSYEWDTRAGERYREQILIDLAEVNGDEFECSPLSPGYSVTKYTISPDGKKITQTFINNVGGRMTNVYKRQK